MIDKEKREANEDKMVEALKAGLVGAPFVTVFKATLGFYLARTIIGLVQFAIVVGVVLFAVHYIGHML